MHIGRFPVRLASVWRQKEKRHREPSEWIFRHTLIKKLRLKDERQVGFVSLPDTLIDLVEA